MGIHNAGVLRVHEARAERDGELDMAGAVEAIGIGDDVAT